MADVLALIPDEYRTAHPTWNGVLSMAIAQALPLIQVHPNGARKDLRAALEAYMRSGTPSDESLRALKEVLK